MTFMFKFFFAMFVFSGGEFLYLDSTSSDEAISDVEEPIVLSSDEGEADEDEEESDENNSMPQVC